MNCTKYGFGKPPRKGTITRKALLLAMRPEGVTEKEAREAGLPRNRLSHIMSAHLREMKGYDVRPFKCARDRAVPNGLGACNAWAWRLIGKMRWDGSYRSFVDPRHPDRPTPESAPSAERAAA